MYCTLSTCRPGRCTILRLEAKAHVRCGHRDSIHRDIRNSVTETYLTGFAHPQKDIVLEKIINLIRQSYCDLPSGYRRLTGHRAFDLDVNACNYIINILQYRTKKNDGPALLNERSGVGNLNGGSLVGEPAATRTWSKKNQTWD